MIPSPSPRTATLSQTPPRAGLVRLLCRESFLGTKRADREGILGPARRVRAGFPRPDFRFVLRGETCLICFCRLDAIATDISRIARAQTNNEPRYLSRLVDATVLVGAPAGVAVALAFRCLVSLVQGHGSIGPADMHWVEDGRRGGRRYTNHDVAAGVSLRV